MNIILKQCLHVNDTIKYTVIVVIERREDEEEQITQPAAQLFMHGRQGDTPFVLTSLPAEGMMG